MEEQLIHQIERRVLLEYSGLNVELLALDKLVDQKVSEILPLAAEVRLERRETGDLTQEQFDEARHRVTLILIAGMREQIASNLATEDGSRRRARLEGLLDVIDADLPRMRRLLNPATATGESVATFAHESSERWYAMVDRLSSRHRPKGPRRGS